MRGGPAALATAGVLLLGGLVAMRCSLAGGDPPAPPRPPPPETPAPRAAIAAPILPALPAAPAPVLPAHPQTPQRSLAAMVPHLAMVANPALRPAAAQGESKPPIANKAALRAQAAAVEPQIVACAAQSAAAGYQANGTARLWYIVAGHPDGKVVIESTGTDDEKTTIDNQPLLDCLKDTANAMQFTYAPDTWAVYAWREVKFTDGKLVENKFVDFHYLK